MTDPQNPLEEPGRRDPWHIKREIQLGHILTTLTVAVSVVVYTGKLEQRIALVEQQMLAQHERDDRQDKATGDALSEVRTQLDRIDANLKESK